MIPLRTSQIAFYAAVVTLTVTLATGVGFWFIRAEMLAGNDFLLDAESEEAAVEGTGHRDHAGHGAEGAHAKRRGDVLFPGAFA
jgi:hypothetical protein